MVSVAERRRYNRLVVPLAVEYQTHGATTAQVQQGKGMLRDISLSGTFFHADPSLDLKPGQIISLTIAVPLPYPNFSETSHLKATGEVVRLEPPNPANPYCGVALQFMEGPSFTSAPLF
jgi:c-di-GMP-binding flagellar brake protein YcgR